MEHFRHYFLLKFLAYQAQVAQMLLHVWQRKVLAQMDTANKK